MSTTSLLSTEAMALPTAWSLLQTNPTRVLRLQPETKATACPSACGNGKQKAVGAGAGRAPGGDAPGAGLRARPRGSPRAAPWAEWREGARPLFPASAPQPSSLFSFCSRKEGRGRALALGTGLCSVNC